MSTLTNHRIASHEDYLDIVPKGREDELERGGR